MRYVLGTTYPPAYLPTSSYLAIVLSRGVSWRCFVRSETLSDSVILSVGYESFNSSQVFIDKYENQTSSLSSNTGGFCQFYKWVPKSHVPSAPVQALIPHHLPPGSEVATTKEMTGVLL